MNVLQNPFSQAAGHLWHLLAGISDVAGDMRRQRKKSSAVQSALDAICHGRWRSAEYALTQGTPDDWCSDAIQLNLLGVCAERQGNYEQARHFYRVAIRADRHFEPAQQNMRRVFELFHFGESEQPFAVGDPFIDLLLASGRLGANGMSH